MSRYHSVCETCGMEDTNGDPNFVDCGHPFWAVVDHYGHEEEEKEEKE